MKIPGSSADRIIAGDLGPYRVILIYGPDQGLVRSRVKKISAAITGNKDPLLLVELEGEQVRQQPSLLFEELQAISFFGGSRVVVVRNLAEQQAKLINEAAQIKGLETPLVLECQNLNPRSKIRQTCEKLPMAAAIACYHDQTRDIISLIHSMMTEARLSIDPEAVTYLASHLGADRQISQKELEKLILVAGKGPVTRSLAMEAVGDNSALAVEDCFFSVLNSTKSDGLKQLERLLDEGQAPVRIIRLVSGLLHRLVELRSAVDKGSDVKTALRQAKPPVHYSLQDRYRAVLQRTSLPALAEAIRIFYAAELECKASVLQDRLILRHAFLKLRITGFQKT